MWRPVHVAPGAFHDAEAPGLLHRMLAGARRLGRAGGIALVDLALPPTCPLCRVPLGLAGGLCVPCWSKIRFIERPWCERLGTPFAYDLGPGTLSAAAIADPPRFRRARSAVAYDGPVPDLVHLFKYADRTDLAPMMVAWMLRAGHELLAEADMIVPVPLHRSRLFSRRYNQAAVLAAGIAARSGLPHRPTVLRRSRRTRQQVGLTREGRAANVQGAFQVPPRAEPLLQGARVLLVDDVFTTGATLEAATRPLLRAGAAAVDVLTFARVVATG